MGLESLDILAMLLWPRYSTVFCLLPQRSVRWVPKWIRPMAGGIKLSFRVMDQVYSILSKYRFMDDFVSLCVCASFGSFPLVSYQVSYNKLILCFSLVNKHLTRLERRLAHKLQGSMKGVHHQNGCICRLAVALKERHNLAILHQLLIKALKRPHFLLQWVPTTHTQSNRGFIPFSHQAWNHA